MSILLPWWLIWLRICLQCRRLRVWSRGWEDPLEKGMATHSSILVWRIPWTEESCLRCHRVGHDWATNTHFLHSVSCPLWASASVCVPWVFLRRVIICQQHLEQCCYNVNSLVLPWPSLPIGPWDMLPGNIYFNALPLSIPQVWGTNWNTYRDWASHFNEGSQLGEMWLEGTWCPI